VNRHPIGDPTLSVTTQLRSREWIRRGKLLAAAGSLRVRRSPVGISLLLLLSFSKFISRQLVRKRRDHLSTSAGEPNREPRAILGDDISVHDTHLNNCIRRLMLNESAKQMLF
jgi:hypothetical protein